MNNPSLGSKTGEDVRGERGGGGEGMGGEEGLDSLLVLKA